MNLTWPFFQFFINSPTVSSNTGEIPRAVSYEFWVEVLFGTREVDSEQLPHWDQPYSIHNWAPSSARTQPFLCVQTPHQDICVVHLQMACKWRVVVQVLQTDLDQIFLDLGKIVVTCVSAQDAKITANTTNRSQEGCFQNKKDISSN